MAALSMEEFYARKLRAALMFAERALADAAICHAANADEPSLASAIGHLRLVVIDLQTAAEAMEP